MDKSKKIMADKTHDREQIAKELDALEQELRALDLWGGESKRPNELLEQELMPFGAGVLEFHQWLEYIFISTFRFLLENNNTLPNYMAIHPYAEEFYKGQWSKYRKLIGILHRLDKLISIEEAKP